jgi:hypothetical protein
MSSPPATVSDAELYAPEIAKLIARFGEVPPLWARYPRVHPMHIHWRMGGGESYKYLFNAWEVSKEWNTAQRIAYMRRWDPPFSWLEWVAWFVWPEDFADGSYELLPEHFDRLAALGFGSREDWQRCYGADIDEYPLADDVSARWIEPAP